MAGWPRWIGRPRWPWLGRVVRVLWMLRLVWIWMLWMLRVLRMLRISLALCHEGSNL